MEKFNKLTGNAIPIRITNVDTDMIIPKQFLKTIKRTGLGEYLFFELKFDQDGNKIDSFALNQDQYNGASILIAGKNFGCGSSREHAPWSIADYGIKCIIAPSYADIFYNNCFKNGILPIKIDDKIVLEIAEYSKRKEEIEINLEKQEISYGNKVAKFEVDAFKKKCLTEGLDDIALSMEKISQIDNFEKRLIQDKPWFMKND